MNLRGGLALIRKLLFSYMSGRGFFWTLAVGWMMGPLVYLFVWTTAAGQGTIAGFARNDFIGYYFCIRTAFQQEAAFRANFAFDVLNTALNFLVGIAGVTILFSQVETIRGWTFFHFRLGLTGRK